jgi:hypothetical protein
MNLLCSIRYLHAFQAVHNKKDPSFEVLFDIAYTLKVPLRELFE